MTECSVYCWILHLFRSHCNWPQSCFTAPLCWLTRSPFDSAVSVARFSSWQPNVRQLLIISVTLQLWLCLQSCKRGLMSVNRETRWVCDWAFQGWIKLTGITLWRITAVFPTTTHGANTVRCGTGMTDGSHQPNFFHKHANSNYFLFSWFRNQFDRRICDLGLSERHASWNTPCPTPPQHSSKHLLLCTWGV